MRKMDSTAHESTVGECRCCLEVGSFLTMNTIFHAVKDEQILSIENILYAMFKINFKPIGVQRVLICRNCVIMVADCYNFYNKIMDCERLLLKRPINMKPKITGKYLVKSLEEVSKTIVNDLDVKLNIICMEVDHTRKMNETSENIIKIDKQDDEVLQDLKYIKKEITPPDLTRPSLVEMVEIQLKEKSIKKEQANDEMVQDFKIEVGEHDIKMEIEETETENIEQFILINEPLKYDDTTVKQEEKQHFIDPFEISTPEDLTLQCFGTHINCQSPVCSSENGLKRKNTVRIKSPENHFTEMFSFEIFNHKKQCVGLTKTPPFAEGSLYSVAINDNFNNVSKHHKQVQALKTTVKGISANGDQDNGSTEAENNISKYSKKNISNDRQKNLSSILQINISYDKCQRNLSNNVSQRNVSENGQQHMLDVQKDISGTKDKQEDAHNYLHKLKEKRTELEKKRRNTVKGVSANKGEKNISKICQKYISTNSLTDSKKIFSTESQKTICTDSQKTIYTDSQKTISTDSQKTICADSQKTICTDFQKPNSTYNQKNVSTGSRKTISLNSQKTISIDSKKFISHDGLINISHITKDQKLTASYFKCGGCIKKNYHTFRGLQMHINRSHFKCNFCHQYFYTRKFLKRHICTEQIQTQIRSGFRCPICSLQFYSTFHLEKHQKSTH